MKLFPGERVRTKSGRLTSPAPEGPSSHTERAMKNALVRLDTWLLREAMEESLDNEWVMDMLNTINPKKMTTAERDMLNDILWGE